MVGCLSWRGGSENGAQRRSSELAIAAQEYRTWRLADCISQRRKGSVAADGGWRVYSSGPGLYTNLLVCHALGIRRRFGERVVAPVLPKGLGPVTLEREVDGRRERWDLSPG